jgi:ribonuclease Z
MKEFRGTTDPSPPATPQPAIDNATMVQNSSHTPQGAFGYLLSQLNPRPRLTVAHHFPTQDDTVESAMKSLQAHCPVYQGENPRPPRGAARVTWAFDRLVITVSKDRIIEQQGVVDPFGFIPTYQPPPGTDIYGNGFKPPKYHNAQNRGDPYAQINTVTAICPCDPTTNACNYRSDGY